MNSPLTNFLILLVILSCILICLTIHELGHFVFAKLFKVNVKEFAIGFGPVLYKTYTKNTHMQISLRLLPIGAYVLMDSAAIRKIYLDEPNAKKYNFYLRPRPHGTYLIEEAKYWQQMLIMFGGILFNVIAFGLFLGIWSAINVGKALDFVAFLKNLFESLGKSLVLYNLWPRPEGQPGPPPPFKDVIVDFDFFLRYLISINLATSLVNFLPVPPLDGWKIMQFSYEKVCKRKLPEKFLTIVSLTGAILLLWITIGSIVNSVV